MLCHIFSNTQKQKVQWMLPLCSDKFSAVIRTHTDTHTVSVAIKRALPVWVLHLVSVFSTDCDGSGVSLLVVLMWRDDTCGSWIERHKGFQIGNMEYLWWAGGLFLLFISPRGIFGTHQPQQRTVKLCWFGLRKKNILVSTAGSQSATQQSVWVIGYILHQLLNITVSLFKMDCRMISQRITKWTW